MSFFKKKREGKSLFSLLFKQGIREIKGSLAQFLSVIAIGGIAVTLFVGLQANAQSLEQRVETMYKDGNLADIFVTTNPIQYDDEDEQNIKDIIGYSGQVESRFYTYVKLNSNNVVCGIAPKYPTISKASEIIEKSDKMDDSHYFIVDEVLCGDSIAEAAGLSLGSTATVSIDLSTYGVEQSSIELLDPFVKEGMNNPLRGGSIDFEFEVTGIMKHPENVERASYSTSLFLLSTYTLKDTVKSYLTSYFKELPSTILNYIIDNLFEMDGGPSLFPPPNQYLVKLVNSSKADEFCAKINAYFDKKGENNNLYNLSTRDNMSFAMTMHTDVTQARQLTYVFPFVFFAVAILVILTTMSQIIVKERTQIGTLKAIGLSRREINFHYMGLTMAVVSIGALIGEILGPLIIPGIMGAKYDLLYNLPARGFTFPILEGLLTLFAFLAIAAITTFLIVRKEVAMEPAQSMRPSTPSIKLKGRNKSKLKLNPHLLSLKMAFRNIITSLVKSSMVIIGVLGCTALLVCGFGIEDTINYGVETDPYVNSGADVTATLAIATSMDKLRNDLYVIDKDGNEIVDGFQPYSRLPGTIYHEGVGYNSYIQVNGVYESKSDEKKDYFVYEFDEDKVIVSSKVARRLNLSPGDEVTFSVRGNDVKAEVQYIFDAFFDNGVFIHSSSSLLNTEITSFSGAWIKTKNVGLREEAKEKISELDYVASSDTQEDWVSRVSDIMSSIMIMTNAVKIFAILLAIVVLYNLGLMNFKDRMRDIATMKVLGFNRFEIASSLLWETMSLTSFGVAIGLIIGKPFMRLVLYINQVELVDYLYTVKPLTYVYSFLLTFVVALAVNMWLATRSEKVKMIESLKSVE